MHQTPLENPLYDTLRAFADEGPLRMHMPGHKGVGLPLPELKGYAAIDFTETGRTGNLYAPGGPVEAAERLWADFWGSGACLFLTGGATQGLHAALSLAAGPGETVLMDRVSHRSLHTGMALLDLRPAWLGRPWDASAGVYGPVAPEAVDAALAAHPGCRAVVITSPTYYGVCSDLPAIAAVCHARGARLVVDGAHGAHLPLFFGEDENPYAAADLAVVSTHKTLPAPGQTALLFATGYDMDELRAASLLFATTSPSYPMMAALDRLRTWLACGGAERCFQAAEAVLELRERYPALQSTPELPLDPMRLTILTEDGFALAGRLEELGLYPEMADRNHVVLIVTGADGKEQIERLAATLDLAGLAFTPAPALSLDPPPAAEGVHTPREALLGRQVTLPLEETEGQIAAQPVAPYPPGVPVVAPGERIEKKHLVYLADMGYNDPVTVLFS